MIQISMPEMAMTVDQMTEIRVNSLSTLGLAHVGDAVYELLVRGMLASQGPRDIHTLHKETVSRVRAEAQAKAFRLIEPYLSEEEMAVYKRGRNTRVHGIPPHASPVEYHSATGMETLFGWLYLLGRSQRLRELFGIIAGEKNNGAG